jgi:hypothetical protein
MKYRLGLLLSLLVAASLAKADIIPVSGTAAFTNDWSYSASGPSFAFEGGESVDHSTAPSVRSECHVICQLRWLPVVPAANLRFARLR